MRETTGILLLALLCGCSGSQVKETAVGVSGALVRGAVETREVDRGVERCKAENTGKAAHCSRDRARYEYQQAATAQQQERARQARQASREQEEYFDRTWGAEEDASESLPSQEQNQQDNAFLDGLSDDLSETLGEPGPSSTL